MIKNRKAWEAFEKERIRRDKVDLDSNLKLFNEMVLEARDLGVFPPKNPLEGIESKIRLARILNGLRKRP